MKMYPTLFLSIVEKKSGGHTLSPHLYGGEKECGIHFQISTVLKGKKSVVHSPFPSVQWGKRVWGTLFHLHGEAKSGGHTFSHLKVLL